MANFWSLLGPGLKQKVFFVFGFPSSQLYYYCPRRRKRILGIVVINALQCQSIYVNPIHLCGQLSKKFLNVLKQMTVIVIY